MTSRLVNDNTEAFYRMSMLYYHMGEAEGSLRYIYNHNIRILDVFSVEKLGNV